MGTVIHRRRRALKLSQATLSSISGVAQPNLSNIERGKSSATLDTYLRLLTALGIDLYGIPRS
ncbi:helix-turn-helix domain-containing protein [Hwanghaeella sp. 1Z406]